MADTQVLLNNPAIHTTLVVGRVNHLKRDEARRAKGILARHMIEPVGMVVTGVPDQRMYGYSAYGEYGNNPSQDATVSEPAPQRSRGSSAKRRLPL